jgi:formate dehydrogenase iron-sulfur subunit
MLNAEKCIGCQYCVAACPFDIPKLSERDGKVRKCTFCQDRLQNGLTPACRKSCPAMALDFGARSDMIAKAQRRALEIKDRFPHVEVYGVQQMGGLGVISVLPFGSDSHREVSNPQTPLMTQIGNALPAVAGIGVLGALGVTAAALIGGRGSEHTVDQYSYDKVRRVVCDDGVAMDPNAPIVKVGLDRKVVKETKDDLKEGEVKGDD